MFNGKPFIIFMGKSMVSGDDFPQNNPLNSVRLIYNNKMILNVTNQLQFGVWLNMGDSSNSVSVGQVMCKHRILATYWLLLIYLNPWQFFEVLGKMRCWTLGFIMLRGAPFLGTLCWLTVYINIYQYIREYQNWEIIMQHQSVKMTSELCTSSQLCLEKHPTKNPWNLLSGPARNCNIAKWCEIES